MFRERPTHLDLFSGIGGFALAAQWAGFRTIGFCEIDKYCQKVLDKNFPVTVCNGPHRTQTYETEQGSNGTQNGIFERGDIARLHGNIFDLDGRQFSGVDLITGGFPCQPFSVAGKRRGAADDREIWPQMFRVIREARPAWVVGENVPGIIPMELDNVLSDLEGIGYATRSFVIPACAVDAKHRRDRLWIVCRRIIPDSCESGSQGSVFGRESENQTAFVTAGCGEEVSDSEKSRLDGQESARRTCTNGCTPEYDGSDGVRWLTEPAVCELVDGVSDGLVRYAGRVATKVPNRVNKLKALGNSIVPQVAYEILREIRKLI